MDKDTPNLSERRGKRIRQLRWQIARLEAQAERRDAIAAAAATATEAAAAVEAAEAARQQRLRRRWRMRRWMWKRKQRMYLPRLTSTI